MLEFVVQIEDYLSVNQLTEKCKRMQCKIEFKSSKKAELKIHIIRQRNKETEMQLRANSARSIYLNENLQY